MRAQVDDRNQERIVLEEKEVSQMQGGGRFTPSRPNPRNLWIIGIAILGSTGTALLLLSRSVALYAALFTWSFLAATLVPLSSEVPLAALVHDRGEWIVPVIVATVGNYLGACTTYGIARWAARATGFGPAKARVHTTAVRLIGTYGAAIMLLSWVPVLGDALVAVAGAAAMPFGRFSLAVVIGKALRYVLVAWAALKI